MNKGYAIINGVMHVGREAMEIAYAHDDLGRGVYEQYLASGKIMEDLA